MKFRDRIDAGHQLTEKVAIYNHHNLQILAVARGGVPIGYEIAKNLHAPLEVIIVRKLGVPHNNEYGIGAIAENSTKIINNSAMNDEHINASDIYSIEQNERKELNRRLWLYKNSKPLSLSHDNEVMIVDDGMATGITMLAVLQSIRTFNPKHIIIAIPVCSQQAKENISNKLRNADTLICLFTPSRFSSVSDWYHNFSQVTDNEVIHLLHKKNL